MGLLAACSGSDRLDAVTILDDPASIGRADRSDRSDAGEEDRGRTIHVMDIPDRVLGESSLDDFLTQSAEAVLMADTNAFGPCPSRALARRTNLFERYEDPSLAVFERNGAKGAFKTSLEVEGCGEPRRHNLLVVTYRDRPTAFLPLLPGRTQVNVANQNKVARQVFLAVEGAAARQCQGGRGVRVRMTGQATDSADSKATGATKGEDAWREVWTVHHCGLDYRVVLDLGPVEQDGVPVRIGEGAVALADLGWPLP